MDKITLRYPLYYKACVNEEKVICFQLELGKKLADVSTECSSRHQGESDKVWTNIAIYSHALLRIHIIGGQRSVRIAPPSLPPHHSGPATRDFHSSIPVEALLWGSFTNSSCPLPWSSSVVSSDGDSPMACSATASRKHLGVPSLLSPVSVWSPNVDLAVAALTFDLQWRVSSVARGYK